MTGLLKSAGRGLLYILVLPVLIVILAVYLVLGVVIFIYIGLKAVILFFTGRNLSVLPEDIKAKEILEGKKEEVAPAEEVPGVQPVDSGYASHYYVPLDQNIPSPKVDNNDNSNDGGEAL